MKHSALLTVITMLILTACDKNPADEPFVPASQVTLSDVTPAHNLPPGHPAVEPDEQPLLSDEPPNIEMTQKGTVVSSIDIPDFTYIEVKQGKEIRWLATSAITVKKGDILQFDEGSTMENFNSKVLDRTFPIITFVNRAKKVKGK